MQRLKQLDQHAMHTPGGGGEAGGRRLTGRQEGMRLGGEDKVQWRDERRKGVCAARVVGGSRCTKRRRGD